MGLEVAVTPQILGQSDDISMELKLNQTNLVGRNPAGAAPMTASHKIDTRLYVRSGESAAVGARAFDLRGARAQPGGVPCSRLHRLERSLPIHEVARAKGLDAGAVLAVERRDVADAAGPDSIGR